MNDERHVASSFISLRSSFGVYISLDSPLVPREPRSRVFYVPRARPVALPLEETGSRRYGSSGFYPSGPYRRCAVDDSACRYAHATLGSNNRGRVGRIVLVEVPVAQAGGRRVRR